MDFINDDYHNDDDDDDDERLPAVLGPFQTSAMHQVFYVLYCLYSIPTHSFVSVQLAWTVVRS